MKQFITILLFMLFMQFSFGQINYLYTGNQLLNNEDFVGAEQNFREAIKSDSTNLIYKNQLALSLMKQQRHGDAQEILNRVLLIDSANLGALWYAGTNNFFDKNSDLRIAVKYFENVIVFLNEKQGQYYSANWFIGRSYQILLQSDGLTYNEVSRMLNSYSTYLKLQPKATDAAKISAYVQHIKDIRPVENVEKWINKQQVS